MQPELLLGQLPVNFMDTAIPMTSISFLHSPSTKGMWQPEGGNSPSAPISHWHSALTEPEQSAVAWYSISRTVPLH